ncbi:MAG: MoxR family ATPase [Deltaproteobacteria bacterium]|nr:MoxR family ATPase [Deltaproteobacteria bacterium]
MPAEVKKLADRISAEISKVIVGQQEGVTHLLVGLLARGHVLMEGVPGLAKTLLAKTLAFILKAEFTRIQFTPDLMPADILGTNIFDLQSRTFHLRQGPIFTEILLGDEINRAPPKTQSALLEAMEERQVSIDGKTLPLSESFMVVATQNPIEQEGTYPLPEAQLDRFLMKIVLHYPGESEEREILARYGASSVAHDLESMGLARLAGGDTVVRFRQRVGQVRVEEGIVAYVQKLIAGTRRSPHLHLGVSPRGGIALLRTSQCLAAVRGRDFVVPDDVKEMALAVLRHRVILRPEAELEGLTPDRVISQILDGIPVPR